jgi:hypothetical protein
MPPCRAIAVAMWDSVTVSILAATTGICKRMLRDRLVEVSTCRRDFIEDRTGTSNTSS